MTQQGIIDIHLAGVYRITSPSGRVYIGMTTRSFDIRWREHKKQLKAGRHICPALQRAHDKYGWENLTKHIKTEKAHWR